MSIIYTFNILNINLVFLVQETRLICACVCAPFAFRVRSSFRVHISFTNLHSAFRHRSRCVRLAFVQRAFIVHSPFAHRSLIVLSPFKWESKTFQGMQLLRSLDLKTRLDPLFHFCAPPKWQFLAMVQRIYPRRAIKNKFIPLQLLHSLSKSTTTQRKFAPSMHV